IARSAQMSKRITKGSGGGGGLWHYNSAVRFQIVSGGQIKVLSVGDHTLRDRERRALAIRVRNGRDDGSIDTRSAAGAGAGACDGHWRQRGRDRQRRRGRNECRIDES